MITKPETKKEDLGIRKLWNATRRAKPISGYVDLAALSANQSKLTVEPREDMWIIVDIIVQACPIPVKTVQISKTKSVMISCIPTGTLFVLLAGNEPKLFLVNGSGEIVPAE